MLKVPQEHGEDRRIARILGDYHSHQGRLNTTHWERPWCWERLKAKVEEDGRCMDVRWTIKKAEHQRIDASQQWCWRKLLNFKDIKPVYPKGDQSWVLVGWHHWFNGHELGQTPGDGEGQGGLACCSPWGRKELDRTYNWTTITTT